MILGLGAGWNETDFTAFGFPFDHLASRFEEALTIVRTLLREGRIDFEGRYYSASDCELRPRGPRRGGSPILVGASGPRMLDITARLADAWNGACNSAERYAPLREQVDAACRAAGRVPASLERTAAGPFAVARTISATTSTARPPSRRSRGLPRSEARPAG